MRSEKDNLKPHSPAQDIYSDVEIEAFIARVMVIAIVSLAAVAVIAILSYRFLLFAVEKSL